MIERDGRYRIQVVAEMTGIPAPTLRAWERRYGVPVPTRTAAAYRLYSDQDVAMVRRLRDLCAGGVSIAEAAKQVRSTEVEGPFVEPESFDAFEAAQARIVGAVLAFDPELVEREVSRAIYLGSAVTVFERVLSPVMRQVGDLWHEGTVSVAQEHIASGVVGNVVRGLARLVQPAAPSRRVVLGCVEDEEHVLGLYGVAIRLASWGIRSVELGARTPPEAVADAVARIEDEIAPIDILVNNAGMQKRAPLHEFDHDHWHELLRTNLASVFIVGQAVAKYMIGRGRGKIINICSVQSELGRPGIAPYTASKGAVKMLTKGMAVDLGPLGINVNGIGPGYFKTELTDALVKDEKFSSWLEARTPLGRWGDVSELQGACVFLAAAASDFVTGHVLFVDGGLTASV